MGYWLDIVSAPIVHGSDIVMGSLLQADRRAEFTSPLGKDVLVLTDFSGSEGLGELFEYHIEGLSDRENIDFDPAIGQGCMVKLKTDDGKTRIYHGIMTEAQWIGYQDEFYRYRVVLRPWLWLLGHKADCRIFLERMLRTSSRKSSARRDSRILSSGQPPHTTKLNIVFNIANPIWRSLAVSWSTGASTTSLSRPMANTPWCLQIRAPRISPSRICRRSR